MSLPMSTGAGTIHGPEIHRVLMLALCPDALAYHFHFYFLFYFIVAFKMSRHSVTEAMELSGQELMKPHTHATYPHT